MKMESLQQRREELERKEYQLKESLLKFDKFLKASNNSNSNGNINNNNNIKTILTIIIMIIKTINYIVCSSNDNN